MKFSKRLIIFIISVLVLSIGGGVAYATNTPTARADRELKLANKYLQDGKYQEAILAFEKVIDIDPKNIPARLGLGSAYINTKEFAKAEVVLKEVIQIDANNIPARENLLKVYLKEGNLDAANTILREMIKIDPNKDVKQLNNDLDSAKAISISKASYDQGIQQMNGKLYLKAMDLFQKVIKDDTERFTDAQAKISDCKKAYVANSIQTASDLAKATKYDDAIKILNDVLKIDANNQDAKNLIEQYTQAKAKQTASQINKDTSNQTANSQTSNIIDRNAVKVGDVIAGLTVKTINNYSGGSAVIKFSGQIELDGTYEYDDNYGDGSGYVFTVSEPDRVKLPYFEGDRSVTSLPILNASKYLTNKSGKAKIVIDNYGVSYRFQIQATADLVKATVE